MEEKPPFKKGQDVVLQDVDRYPNLKGHTLPVGGVIHRKGHWWIALGGNPDYSFRADAFRLAS